MMSCPAELGTQLRKCNSLKNNKLNIIEPDLCNDQKQPHMKEQKLDIDFRNSEYDHVNNFIFFDSCPSFTN